MHYTTQGSSHHIFATNPRILGTSGYLEPPRRSYHDWNVEKGEILPEAAESPAPATATICFDDDSNSWNAAMSWDALELILRMEAYSRTGLFGEQRAGQFYEEIRRRVVLL